MTTLLNLNHVRITQPELCLKDTFVKVSFMFFTIFLDIYENPRRKNLINPPCPMYPKIILIKKMTKIFILTLLCGASKSSEKIKKLCHFPVT